jgi:hypothetical protein
MSPATYRTHVTIPHPTGLGVFDPGSIIVEGRDVPLGWTPPSGDCEPLNEPAVWKVYSTRPALPSSVRSITPKAFWKVLHHSSHDEWSLTGLGSSLPPVNM